MMLAIEVLLFAALLPFVAAAFYLALLSALALLPDRPRASRSPALRRFALLIPARNEEQRLPALIESIRALDYPPELFSVLVVADNCTDATAAVARAAGVPVCERQDEVRIGKGYAIDYGLSRIPEAYDAVAFVDGDCTVSRNLLRAFNDRMDAGDEAVQAYYTMGASGASSTQAARALALTLVHLVRPRGKQRIGASVGLKGSGMGLSKRLLDAAGWQVFGLAEDIEQHTRLLRLGARVGFACEAVVTGAAPDTLADARGQHRRWEAGRLAAARKEALPLLLEGLRMRSMPRFDAAVELLVPPLSALAMVLVLGIVAGAALRAPLVWWPAGAGVACLAVYVCTGMALARQTWRATLGGLAALPVYAAWKLAVYGQSIVSKPQRWEQTHRDAADAPAPDASTSRRP